MVVHLAVDGPHWTLGGKGYEELSQPWKFSEYPQGDSLHLTGMSSVRFIYLKCMLTGTDWQADSIQPLSPGFRPPSKRKRKLTMSTTLAMTKMKMANMAQVFLAQRVRSIQDEKATSFLGND